MEWSGQEKFVESQEVPFMVDGSEAGVLKNYGPLSFLKVSLSLTCACPSTLTPYTQTKYFQAHTIMKAFISFIFQYSILT